MKKILYVIPLLLIISACSSPTQTFVVSPSSTISPTITTTNTLEPTSTNTLTPTPTPITLPDEYLLKPNEMPVEIGKSSEDIYLEGDGSVTYRIHFFHVIVGRIQNLINVSVKPFSEFPDLSSDSSYRLLFTIFSDMTEITDPSLGGNAKAYSGGERTNFTFYKGNSLVQIIAWDMSLQDVINMGKIIEDRLPDEVPFIPIQFPSVLNTDLFNSLVSSVTLTGECQYPRPLLAQDVASKSVFSISESGIFCLDVRGNLPDTKFQYAIYDLDNQVIVQKFIPEYSIGNNFLFGVHHPGDYEIWLSGDGELISKIPFEVID